MASARKDALARPTIQWKAIGGLALLALALIALAIILDRTIGPPGHRVLNLLGAIYIFVGFALLTLSEARGPAWMSASAVRLAGTGFGAVGAAMGILVALLPPG